MVGNFSRPTVYLEDSYLWGGGRSGACLRTLSLTNGTTREWRVDLVSLDNNATNAAELVVSDVYGPGYCFFKFRDFAMLLKWSRSMAESLLWCERTQPLPHSNVVMTLALTRQDPNLVITT